jgi:hypothetical protein
MARRAKQRKPAGGKAKRNRVKSHTRSPRGPNKGKPTVRVKGYRRSTAKRKR